MEGSEIASFDEEPTLDELIEVIDQFENRTRAETAAGVLLEWKEVSMRDYDSTAYELINEGE